MRETATHCNKLHRDVERTATNYAKSGNVETNLYAHPYAQDAVVTGNSKRSVAKAVVAQRGTRRH